MALFMLIFRDYPAAVPESALAGLSQAVGGDGTSELDGPSFWARAAIGSLNRHAAGSADPALLHGAISLLRFAVQGSEPGTGVYALYLSDLVRALRHVDRWAAAPGLADEVMRYGRRSASAAKFEDPDSVLGVGVLVGILVYVNAATGEPRFLDEAIEVGTRLTDDPLVGGLEAEYQLTLFPPTATALHARYGDLGALADLMRAVDLERRLSDLAVHEPETLAESLSVLGVSLTDLFMRTEDEEHIREAVENHRRALTSLRRGSAVHAETSYLLACSLSARFRVTHDRRHLDQAIEAAVDGAVILGDLPIGTARRHALAALLAPPAL